MLHRTCDSEPAVSRKRSGWLALALVGVMITVAACGGGSDSGTESDSADTADLFAALIEPALGTSVAACAGAAVAANVAESGIDSLEEELTEYGDLLRADPAAAESAELSPELDAFLSQSEQAIFSDCIDSDGDRGTLVAWSVSVLTAFGVSGQQALAASECTVDLAIEAVGVEQGLAELLTWLDNPAFATDPDEMEPFAQASLDAAEGCQP